MHNAQFVNFVAFVYRLVLLLFRVFFWKRFFMFFFSSPSFSLMRTSFICCPVRIEFQCEQCFIVFLCLFCSLFLWLLFLHCFWTWNRYNRIVKQPGRTTGIREISIVWFSTFVPVEMRTITSVINDISVRCDLRRQTWRNVYGSLNGF